MAAEKKREILRIGTEFHLSPDMRRPNFENLANLYQALPLELKMAVYALAAPFDSKNLPSELGNHPHIYHHIIKEQYVRSSTIFPLEPIPQGTTVKDGKLFPGQSAKDHLQWLKVLRADVFATSKRCLNDLRVYVRGRCRKRDEVLLKTTLSHSSISNKLLVLWRLYGFPGQSVNERREIWAFLYYVPLWYLEEVDEFLTECADNMRVTWTYQREKTVWRYNTENEGIGLSSLVAKTAAWIIMVNSIHVIACERSARLREIAELKIAVATQTDQEEKQKLEERISMLLVKSQTTTSITPACRGETCGVPRWNFPGGDHAIDIRTSRELSAAGIRSTHSGIRGNGLVNIGLEDRYRIFHDILTLRRQGIRKTYRQWTEDAKRGGSTRDTLMRFPFWHWMHWKLEDDETLGILDMEMRVA
ncbi:hypothetical protein IWZ00DRAFT_489152 [Phyllosticta capitalensis]